MHKIGELERVVQVESIKKPKNDEYWRHNAIKSASGYFLIIRLILSAAIFTLDNYIQAVPHIREYLYIAAFMLVYTDVFFRAIKSIMKNKEFDANFLMSLSGAAALGLGMYFEGTAILFLCRLGELINGFVRKRAHKNIEQLKKLQSEIVCVLINGDEINTPAELVAPGSLILVKPGERIGLDGIVYSGSSAVNTAAITGRTIPKIIHTGDMVLAGFVNISNPISVEVTASQAQSTLSRIFELAHMTGEKTKNEKPFKTLGILSGIYTPVLIVILILAAFLPSIIMNFDINIWINKALTALVISCPCALVISIPLTYSISCTGALKNGILFKSQASAQSLANVKTIVFDKSGTLTTGRYKVVSIEPENIAQKTLLMMAAHAESFSTDPLASAVVNAYEGPIEKSLISDYKNFTGMGINVMAKDISISCGNADYMEMLGVPTGDDSEDENVLYVSASGKYAGRIILSDTLKEDSAAAVFQLQRLGVKRIVLLSEDGGYATRKTANALGINEFYPHCLPEDKIKTLSKIMRDSKKSKSVAFAGDGKNNAPAIAMADVGISMGAMGTDGAIEVSDVVIINDAPIKIAQAIDIAKSVKRINTQNIIIAMPIKAFILGLALYGAFPFWAIFAVEAAVSLLAFINSLRAGSSEELYD